MKLIMAVLLSVVITGCGAGQPFTPRAECRPTLSNSKKPIFSAIYLESADPTCDAIQDDARLALDLLALGGLGTPEGLASTTDDLTVWVMDDDSEMEHNEAGSMGMPGSYDHETKRVMVTMPMEGLVHEVLHAYERNTLGMPAIVSATHENWSRIEAFDKADRYWRIVMTNER